MSQYITGNCYKCYTFNKPAPSGHMPQNSICPDQIPLFWLLCWLYLKESLALTLTSIIYNGFPASMKWMVIPKRARPGTIICISCQEILKSFLWKAFDIFLIRGCVQFFSAMPFAACWVADNNNIACPVLANYSQHCSLGINCRLEWPGKPHPWQWI